MVLYRNFPEIPDDCRNQETIHPYYYTTPYDLSQFRGHGMDWSLFDNRAQDLIVLEFYDYSDNSLLFGGVFSKLKNALWELDLRGFKQVERWDKETIQVWSDVCPGLLAILTKENTDWGIDRYEKTAEISVTTCPEE